MTAPGAEPVRCGVYASGPHMGEPCGFMGDTNAGTLQFSYHVIQNEGDRLSLGARSRLVQPQRGSTVTLSIFDMMSLPEKQYTLEPGKDLKIEIDGLGTVILRGEMLDHMPVLSSSTESLLPYELSRRPDLIPAPQSRPIAAQTPTSEFSSLHSLSPTS